MINCALIGYGRWGKILYKNIYENKNLKLKVIFYNKSIDKKNIKSDVVLSKRYNNYNYQSIQLVFIAANAELNYKLCKFYLRKKINVFVEKPISISEKNLKELISIAKQNKCILHVDYIHLFNKNFINFSKIVKREIKKNLQANIKIKMGSNFFKKKKIDSFWDWGAHVFSILSKLLNIKKIKVISFKKNFTNSYKVNYKIILSYEETKVYLIFGNNFRSKKIKVTYKDKNNYYEYGDSYYLKSKKNKLNSLKSFNDSPLQKSINQVSKNIINNKIYQCTTSKKISYIMENIYDNFK